ncbi:hypothetical protein [Ensifer soli]|uniref:hypothetical protein n=1 Tax=Ciceribacter sp. sgz301302 TaxID=3342379 RepID=UPI0035BA4D04
MKLDFDIAGARWTVTCAPDKAPRTLAALAAHLPMALQLHTPKIAGSHIYWHAPFVEDVEGAVHVLDARPGAFIYWPVRQFLEITFAPLQAETASVTVLGHLDGPVEGIAALAARLRDGQGRGRFEGTLSLADSHPFGKSPAAEPGVPAGIIEARRVLWAACPADIAALTRSRAIMHPAGPVFMAESEARVLHETLWWVRERLERDPAPMLRYAAALALNKAAVRLRDFCHLSTSADALFALEAALADETAALAALVDQAILTSGRIAAWIDLLIPWSDVNTGFRAALDGDAAPRAAAG